MRIITGKFKGRHFDIPRTFKARPTTDFAKENIFNVLNGYLDFDGATALDLFAGTGSITLELLSRGCSQVVSVEKDRDHHRFIQQCVEKLNPQISNLNPQISNLNPQLSARPKDACAARTLNSQLSTLNSQCLRADVFKFIGQCHQQFDFIFADPPYALKELPTIPDLIFSHGLLAADGIFVFEHGKDHDFSQHPHFVEHRSYGSVNFTLFR